MPQGRCFAPASTEAVGRCPTTPPTTAGRPTPLRLGWTSTSISSATPTPPSSSTPGCRSRPYDAASATPPPKPPSSTPCSTTRSPTLKSAPLAGTATAQHSDGASSLVHTSTDPDGQPCTGVRTRALSVLLCNPTQSPRSNVQRTSDIDNSASATPDLPCPGPCAS